MSKEEVILTGPLNRGREALNAKLAPFFHSVTLLSVTRIGEPVRLLRNMRFEFFCDGTEPCRNIFAFIIKLLSGHW